MPEAVAAKRGWPSGTVANAGVEAIVDVLPIYFSEERRCEP